MQNEMHVSQCEFVIWHTVALEIAFVAEKSTRHFDSCTLWTMSSWVPSGRVRPSSCIRGTNENPKSFFSPLSFAEEHKLILLKHTWCSLGLPDWGPAIATSATDNGKWRALHCKLIAYKHTYSLTHLSNLPLTHLLTHPLANSLTHSPDRSLTHPLIQSLTRSPTHSLAHSLTHSLAHSLTRSLAH